MRAVAIIQARMDSTRLPGKVLRDICGRSMLALVAMRVRTARSLSEVVVATTLADPDDAIAQECHRLGVAVFRGDETDVLDRYYRAALVRRAETIVRITADCPLIDPEVVDDVVAAFVERRADYASNTLQRTFPRGLDVEVVGIEALARAHREAVRPYERAHVTPYLYQHPTCFRLASVVAEANQSRYRWTVDTWEDLVFIREVCARCGTPERVRWREVMRLLRRWPDLLTINRDVRQKALHEG